MLSCNRIIFLLKQEKFPVIVGGNHTVSIGSARAFSEHFENLSILQLDAHSDLRQEYEGSVFNHACAIARMREVAPVIQVGIRSMSREEASVADWDRIFPAHELYVDKTKYAEGHRYAYR